ncbi:MAG: outer membrane beta-barrel protein [Salinibacter sp.]
MSLLFVALGLLMAGPPTSSAQEFRIGVGGGWAVPTNNVEPQIGSGRNARTRLVDLKPGPHVYVGVGFVRSIGEQLALGARVRGQTARLRSDVPACNADMVSCTDDPDGRLQAATVEGRIILTSPDWIHPYLLVSLGIVHANVGSVMVNTLSFPEASVTDAGGDVGLGASLPLAGGLQLDAEFRVTGALPGGKENAVTTLPLSLGLGYQF